MRWMKTEEGPRCPISGHLGILDPIPPYTCGMGFPADSAKKDSNSGPAREMSQNRNKEQNQKNVKNNLCYASRCGRDTSKSQNRGDYSDDEKSQSHTQHRYLQ